MLWLPTETGRLMNRMLGVPADAIHTNISPRPETWAELCGRYEHTGRLTDIRARLMTGFGADVFVAGDKLMLRLLTPVWGLLRGVELHPDSQTDPDVFRVRLGQFGLPTARIVFTRKPGMGATAMQLDIFPMSLRRRAPARRRPKAWQMAAVSIALSITATLLARRIWRSPRGSAVP